MSEFSFQHELTFARLDDRVLHYALAGSGRGPALVFANSLGTDLRIWNALVERFADAFRIVCYDKRGHGLSDAPPAPYTIANHVDDLAALLDQLEVRDAVVCGVSVGGIIAQGLAVGRPDLVRGLVLCDTAAKIGPASMWEDRIAAIRKGGIEALADAIMERWFSPVMRSTRPAALRGWRNMLTRTPVEGYIGTCCAIRDADLSERSATIAVPTLVVCGDHDGATPPDLVRSLAALIPGARFCLIEDAGHLPCIEQPAALGDEMARFFEENKLV